MLRRLCTLTIAAAFGLVGSALALPFDVDPPDSQVNVVSGVIETADTPWTGTNYEIRHVSAAGAGHPEVITTLTNDAWNDLGARLVIDAVEGDSWVAWWRDLPVDQVLVRKRNRVTGTWAPERVQSVSSEGSRHPSMAWDGSQAWIAYEADGAGSATTTLKAKYVDDDPAPFLAATLVATTSYTGTVQVRIQAESGHVWLTWVDSTEEVGWSRYDSVTATWTAPAFESYASDSVDDARGRIRSSVFAN